VNWLFGIYAVMSLVAGLAYWLDKRLAQGGGRRLSERTLHLLALAGGWPGALLAQRLVRHKNRKVKFQLVFWLIVALHVATWAWWLRR
jgi:uncharacterized membrane protein YsdA (DUF1294 family)